MLRSFLLKLSKSDWVYRRITGWRVTRRMSARFIAGEDTEDAIRAVRKLNDQGILATLDHLGENTTQPEDAQQATREVLSMIRRITEEGLRCNVSVKLSQLGLTLDEELCNENLETILNLAQELGNFVRIDMEDSSLTERTMQCYFRAREKGYRCVGVVIQAYLYRSKEDIHQLSARQGHVRLCKGAYNEPASVAYPKKKDVDANYDRLTAQLMDCALSATLPLADGIIPPVPAIATHDPLRITFAQKYAESIHLPRNAFEFQMLYGIRRDLQTRLVSDGYSVRVYVPYGTHWYPYFMRRLAERPANVWFILTQFFQRGS